jgi:hypothetical protein
MGCCLLSLVGWFFPRLVIVGLWLFTDHLSRAFQTVVWPVLGFLFLPYTTLAWVIAQNFGGGLNGFYLVGFVIAVLLDLGFFGSSGHSFRQRRGGMKMRPVS